MTEKQCSGEGFREDDWDKHKSLEESGLTWPYRDHRSLYSTSSPSLLGQPHRLTFLVPLLLACEHKDICVPYTGITSGPTIHCHPFSGFWPVVDLCHSLCVLQKEAALMRSESCTSLQVSVLRIQLETWLTEENGNSRFPSRVYNPFSHLELATLHPARIPSYWAGLQSNWIAIGDPWANSAATVLLGTFHQLVIVRVHWLYSG